jgi:hypothetical protein
MLMQEFGSLLLGFTKKMRCPHCNNEKAIQIRQDYVKQSVFFIPVPTSHNKIFLFCSVCEHKDTLVGWKPMFAGQDKMNYILDLLDGGKEITKYWISTLSFKDKEAALKRLNALKAYDLVRYVGS